MFVQTTRSTLQQIRELITSKQTTSKLEQDKRQNQNSAQQQRIHAQNQANQQFVVNQQQTQQQILQEQDASLDDLSRVAERLGMTATVINTELEDQAR
tara:strand:+ start:226 stop:519 length:294 start_codon:yes stop_codon:yes gene_type:complete